jgi:hypothetical protein
MLFSGCVTDNTIYLLTCDSYNDETIGASFGPSVKVVEGYVVAYPQYTMWTDENNYTHVLPARCDVDSVE